MASVTTEERRDDGTVLPMVLVLILIASLIVVPMLSYTTAVFKSNRVVSQRTAKIEAAKGGLRMALADPKNVFLTCDGGGNLTPADPTINGISVQTTCTEISEVGPSAALGYAEPKGAVAMQLGADLPIAMSGKPASSGPAYPYPATPDWWATPAPPDPSAQYSVEASEDLIWTPDLPLIPPTSRTSTPFDMPAGFDCKVFFPGRYSQPLALSGNLYFTSGVYYFEAPVTVTADADVVVGYGLEDFTPASDCADDLQVASNVLNPPASFGISGGGGTWVFGAGGRLVIDNAAMGAGASIRFNQRYDAADRGGRVSIMTVNGDDAAAADHDVEHVNRIPRSLMLNGTYQVPIDGSGYVPSSSTYTDKARLPQPPAGFTESEFRTSSPPPNNGGAVLTWNEVTGQAAGGALLGQQDTNGAWTTSPYDIQIRRKLTSTWSNVCPPSQLLTRPGVNPGDPNTIVCAVTGLDTTRQYDVRVRTVNTVGASAWATADITTLSTSPVISRPNPPTSVAAAPGVADDVAQITWNAPAFDGGIPVTSYTATAYSVALVPHPNVAPIAPVPGTEQVDVGLPLPLTPNSTVTAHVRAFDPNGDDLTLTIDTTALPIGLSAVANDADDTITVTASSLTLIGSHVIPYTVRDPDGAAATGSVNVNVKPIGGLIAQVPSADPVQLLADVGVSTTTRLPVADRDGMPLAATPVAVDTSGLSADWTVTVSGSAVTITTVAPNGTWTIPYTVTDASGSTASSTIAVTIARDIQPAGSCTVTANPGVPMSTACEMSVPDLLPGTPTSGYVGYQFDVVATNAAGTSDPAPSTPPLPLGFNGGGVGLLPAPARMVTPWVPEPIIDVRASGGAPVELAVAGYVAVPMGRLGVDNPNGYNIRINGGVMAGTYDLDDSRATAAPDSLPIGFKNDIVLQRKVSIVSVAGRIRSTAIVELNEDGAGYAVNAWVVG